MSAGAQGGQKTAMDPKAAVTGGLTAQYPASYPSNGVIKIFTD